MKISVILAHPDRGSFNHSVAWLNRRNCRPSTGSKRIERSWWPTGGASVGRISRD